jgi:hypothetical protein
MMVTIQLPGFTVPIPIEALRVLTASQTAALFQALSSSLFLDQAERGQAAGRLLAQLEPGELLTVVNFLTGILAGITGGDYSQLRGLTAADLAASTTGQTSLF